MTGKLNGRLKGRRREDIFNQYNRDYYGGALMLLLGLGAITEGIRYKVGELRHMGPGFFPVALGAILVLLGVAIALGAHRADRALMVKEERLAPEWRGWFCILGSIVAFVVLGKYGGLLPATFAIVFISALGDRDNSVKAAALLALAICVACVIIFWWALKMQFPLFTWG